MPFLLKEPHHAQRFPSQPSSPLRGDNTLAAEQSVIATPSPLKYSSLPSYPGKQKHKEENLHGSSLSLGSNASSVYSTQEDRTNAEISKLQDATVAQEQGDELPLARLSAARER